MKRTSFFILLTSILIFQNVKSQAIDSLYNIEKAVYTGGNIKKLLFPEVKYPINAQYLDAQGDVVISFVVLKNGKLDSLAIVKSPDKSLSISSLAAMDLLEKDWKPAQINGVEVNKKYLMVFRYRIYFNESPEDIIGDARKSVDKQKYKKALSQYNRAIKDNQYESELYIERAKVKEILGNFESAKQDKLVSIRYKEDVMSIIDVIAIGIKNAIRTTTITNTITKRVIVNFR